jgi:ribosomal protein S18 acetylase RimI-like enzyme
MSALKIVDYQPVHQPFFDALNRAWIEEWFQMEAVDEWVLTNPDKALLDTGGAIFMAEWDGRPVGTVALRKVADDCYEFTKMAVDPAYRRRGIAEELTKASFRHAAILGAQEIILYSNTKNEAAVRLYERIGFQHLPVEKGVYERANVKMRIDIEDALRICESASTTVKS